MTGDSERDFGVGHLGNVDKMNDGGTTSGTLQHRSLVDLAVDEVQRMILSGIYNPGDPLREQHLTDKLGISRAPLREALRVLEQRGIVEQIPRRGVRVVSLSDIDVNEIYSLRDALDRFAVTLGFPNPDPAGLAAMRAAMVDMRKAAEVGDHAMVVLTNRSFHLALVGLSGHNRLRRTYEGLMDQMQLCMSANLRQETSRSGNYHDGVRRHERLLASVEGGDPAEVLVALAEHGSRSFLR
jgi:DNA-binding GntR family transcriptional regulator